MNRRSFLLGVAAVAAEAATAPARRVYSFLWDNPLVTVPNLNGDHFDPLLRGQYIYSEFDYAELEMRVLMSSVASSMRSATRQFINVPIVGSSKLSPTGRVR